MQRDVELTIETTDKGGAAIGSLFNKAKSLGEELLIRGLAKVQKPSLQSALRRAMRFFLQRSMREGARIKVWENYDEEEAQKQREAEMEKVIVAEASKVVLKAGSVTHIEDAATIWVQWDTTAEEKENAEALARGIETFVATQADPELVHRFRDVKERFFLLCTF